MGDVCILVIRRRNWDSLFGNDHKASAVQAKGHGDTTMPKLIEIVDTSGSG